MSSSKSHSTETDASPPLGARENFWDHDEQEYDDSSEEETPTGPRRTDVGRDWGNRHSFVRGRTKAEYVAHSLLKRNATVLCPFTLHAPPNRGQEPLFEFLFGDGDPDLDHDPDALHTEREPVELSDPQLHIPKSFPDGFAPEESGQYRLRRRFNPEYGYVSFGGKIANRPTDEFMEVVDSLLDWVVAQDDNGVERDDVEGVRDGAFNMKIGGDLEDVDIMERVIEDLLGELDA